MGSYSLLLDVANTALFTFFSYTCVSQEVFANPEAITFFTRDQQMKGAMVNSGAGNMMKLCREHKPILVSGGDMFGKGYQVSEVSLSSLNTDRRSN